MYLADSCTNPKFSNIRTSVTQDTKLNTETAYIVEFNVQCAKNSKNELFYGEIDGKFIAASTDETGEKRQVVIVYLLINLMYLIYKLFNKKISWTESHKKARTGEITIRIFDEDGFGEAKKIQRNNGDLSKVKELTTVSFYHKVN